MEDMCPFGEVVMYRELMPSHRKIRDGRRYQKGDSAWRRGVWLGGTEDGEHLVGTDDGTTTGRTVRRLDQARRTAASLLGNTGGVPWGLLKGRPRKSPVPYLIMPVVPMADETMTKEAVPAEASDGKSAGPPGHTAGQGAQQQSATGDVEMVPKGDTRSVDEAGVRNESLEQPAARARVQAAFVAWG
jgi:hypothetical protein